jgi:pyrimidine-nucleoside phosphorylase
LGKFRELVQAQGGDVRVVDDPSRLASAAVVHPVSASEGGYVRRVDARTVGEASVRLGAGRARKSDPVDHAVGIVVHVKVGDRVVPGDPLFTVHAKDRTSALSAAEELLGGISFSRRRIPPLPLFYRTLRS